MELFRIIKSDGLRAMRFCGGRTVASVMIIALAYLTVSLTESVLFIIFCGNAAFYQDILTLSKFYNEAIYVKDDSSEDRVFNGKHQSKEDIKRRAEALDVFVRSLLQ